MDDVDRTSVKRNPTTTGKATFTGDRCDGMAVELVNWLTEHAEEVSFRQFAKHVDVRSFEVGPLSRCDHCTFLRTTLPSGGEAWVLQWSGFEHLAVDDPSAVDIDTEAELAFQADLSPHGEPVVWWDDKKAIDGLGGLQAMERFDVARAHNVWNGAEGRFDPEPVAWTVSADVLRAAGVEPVRKERWETRGLGRTTSGVYRDNPTESTDPVEMLPKFANFVAWFAREKDPPDSASQPR